MTMQSNRPMRFLLVEDSEGDIELTRAAMSEAKVSNEMSVVRDGVEAMAFLRKEGEYADAERPDLILLDLNMPRMDGR
jgi:CheY-like chemotaxis protein